MAGLGELTPNSTEIQHQWQLNDCGNGPFAMQTSFTTNLPPIILASASPRRRDLLAQIEVVPAAICATDIDETPHKAEKPTDYAVRMAVEKAMAGVDRAKAEGVMTPDSVILAGDTVVACGRRILPKTEDIDSAKSCLELLSGRRHRVFGGIAVRLANGQLRSRLVTSTVRFKRLDKVEIDCYLASGDWQGKAGGYAIQGPAARLIQHIDGSYSNIVGFSLYDVSMLLSGLQSHG